ncbi:hypothetical protein ASG35_15300 [Burkholderia sp. Leaf177]|nr:hypothetical protein ASG35_15300 [Burkholderia sp. Leaf177]
MVQSKKPIGRAWRHVGVTARCHEMFQILALEPRAPRISFADEQFVYIRAASAIGLIGIMFLAFGHASCEISCIQHLAFLPLD